MKRFQRGALIVAGLVVASGIPLALAVAWGPHTCGPISLKVLGCAIGNYESLAGGLFAADAAIFAGWLAWSAVQAQIAAEEARANADRTEAERLLKDEMMLIAEALSAIWRISELLAKRQDEVISDGLDVERARSAVRYGVERIADERSVASGLLMASVLGWERRRLYEPVYQGLTRIRRWTATNDFDAWEVLSAVKSVAGDLRMVQPAAANEFEGFFERPGKAWSFGQSVLYDAGMMPGDGVDDHERLQASRWVPKRQW